LRTPFGNVFGNSAYRHNLETLGEYFFQPLIQLTVERRFRVLYLSTMAVITLAPVDWMNAVFIPLVLLLTVNTALAIYGAYVLARWINFRQQIHLATLEFVHFPGKLANCGSSNVAPLTAKGMFGDIPLNLHADLQDSVRLMLERFSARRATQITKYINDYKAAKGYPVGHMITDLEWRALALKFQDTIKQDDVEIIIQIMFARPDFHALLGVTSLKLWLVVGPVMWRNRERASDEDLKVI
jgi:hypothetical protein